MSLLMPLYIAGLAAISLPLIFHLIRRSPRGQVVFSSLMFLSRSPPRLTRRSRLDQWLLFLLRALAILLLANPVEAIHIFHIRASMTPETPL